ncbi:MAG: 30S ribosomal protein S6 [Clostridia bacterium]|jgi:small subunit ribosomal protein S6|nr:30S ribosomal protein S6 [Clostridia bacterium]
MTKYEMLYILDASLADEAKESIIKKFESLVADNGGVVENVDRWGVKKLQYPINYKTEGYYVLMTFEAAKTLVEEIKRIAGITDGLIRRLITKR